MEVNDGEVGEQIMKCCSEGKAAGPGRFGTSHAAWHQKVHGAAGKVSWSELTSTQRGVVVAVGAVEVSLAAAAWTDLARRPAERVNGPKALWAVVIGINIVGPIAYFARGRRRSAEYDI